MNKKSFLITAVFVLVIGSLNANAFISATDQNTIHPTPGAAGEDPGAQVNPDKNSAGTADAKDKNKNKIEDELEDDAGKNADGLLNVIVLFEREIDNGTAARYRELGAEIKHNYKIIPGSALKIPAGNLNRLGDLPGLKMVYKDREVRALLDSSVPVIKADQARSTYGLKGTGTVIAIIDTGIDPVHSSIDDMDDNPATSDPKLIGWKDIINNRADAYDDHGHGTHVASIAAGTGGGTAYVGVAPGAKLVGVKVLNSYGSGTFSQVIAGIDWAAQNKDVYGINVISMSLGANINSDGTSPIEVASDNAVDAGINVVVAAGNSGPGSNTVGIPASAKKVITIGAVDDGMNIAYWSSRGPTADGRIKPEVSAVGVGVIAAQANTGTGYVSMSGTSMATPHVSGVVSLLLEYNPSLTPSEIKQVLMDSAIDKGDIGPDNTYGWGVVDTMNAAYMAKPSRTYTVDDSGGANFTKITDAINAASAGDTILVYSGSYNEYVRIDKQLILKGVDDGGGKPVVTYIIGEIFSLRADGVTVDGFEIANAKSYSIEYATGIDIRSSNNTIRNNTISNNEEYGIYMVYGNNNRLENNIISNNGWYGIIQYYGINNILSNNSFLNNKWGIALYSANDNKIYNNIFNNTQNVVFWSPSVDTWSIRQPGTNIAGGPYLGGNYWAAPNGAGFSQMCTDTNLDGFCDSPYTLDSNNIDYLPLRKMPSADEQRGAYYYSDDFTDTAVNSSKWNADIATGGKRWCSSTVEDHHTNPGEWINVELYPCNGYTQASPYGAVTVADGQASFSSGIGRTFPYIWSGPPGRQSPFPDTGDFILELRMKYDSIQPNGDGVQVLFWNNTDPAGNNPPVPSGQSIFGVWADSTMGPPEPLKFHEHRLEYIGGKYSAYFDGMPSWGPAPSSIRANTIWLGNPVFNHWWGTGDWTDFTIDYVRVLVPDYTPPVTDIALSGTTGQNNWYTSDVRVTLTAEDNPGGWGVAMNEYSIDGVNWHVYSPPLIIKTEGITTLSYRSRDIAGNIEDAKEIVIKIDKSKPIIKGGITTADKSNLQTIFVDDFSDNNYDGWTIFEGCMTAQNGYLEKVCTSSGNGARTPVAVNADVVNLSFDWKIQGDLNWNCQGMAVSMEGSPGIPAVTVWPDYCYPWNGETTIKLGLSIPDIGFSNYITLPRDNNWHNARLTIYHGMYTVYHDGNPVLVAFGPERINSSWLTASGWTHWTKPGSGWDNFKVEAAPLVSSMNGWYDSDVIVRFAAVDIVSGVNSVTPDTPVLTEGGNQYVPGSVIDIAGISNSTAVSGINIDKTPPDITITVPSDGAEYLLNQEVIADWSAADHLSGVAWATGTVSDGSPVDTGTPGEKTFTVTASDNVNRTANKTVTYYVRYTYSGILEPINANGSSIFNSNKNSIIPVKFQLQDAFGGFAAGAVADIYQTRISDTVTGTIHEDVVTGNATPGNRFIYNSTGNEYFFNLPTQEMANGTWQVEIRLDDGTSKYANFSVKK